MEIITVIDFNRYCLPSSQSARDVFFKNAGIEKAGQYMSDLYTAWKVLLIACGLSFVLAFFYMIFLRCCAKLLVWLTFIGFICLLAILGGLFWEKANNAVDSGDKLNYQILAVIFWVVDFILFLVICCLYDDIQLALTVIQASATFIFQQFWIVFVPIITIIITIGYIAFWISVLIYIYSIGTITQKGNTPLPSVSWSDETKQIWYYHLFALFWIVAFFIGALQFIVAATAAQWYFSHGTDQAGKGSVCKSLYWSIRYHLGSLAIGSLLLAIIMFIRFIFEYMRVKIFY